MIQHKSEPSGFGNTKKCPFSFSVFGLFVSSCCCFRSNQGTFICNIHAYRHPIYWPTGKHLLFPLLLYQGGTQRRFPPKNIESSFQAIQSTFRPLALHYKRRYKTCICSVILGKFESFRNCKGFGIVFSKSFRCIPYFFY